MPAPPEIAAIERDIAFQRRAWRAERIGWAGMLAVVAAALLGAFGGGGPIAGAEARIGGLSVEWARVQRLGATTPLRIALPMGTEVPAPRLPPDFARRWRLRDAAPPAGGPVIALHLEPLGPPGPRRLRLEVAGQALDLPVFVWP